ncbi:MAG: V-type ATP synthase subunit E [Spirochaetaceae bacterium]|nr:MAG: V-type ATP synthase subunit E [Spirochaetaceae bacterium]
MDVQLKEIIEKIKSEGVQNAEARASEIIAEAESKAQEITAAAEKNAAAMKQKAEQEAAKREESGKSALSQAGRDLLIKVEAQLQAQFESIINSSVDAAFTSSTLETAVVEVVKSWSAGKSADLNVLLPEKEYTKIEQGLRSKLAAELKSGLEIKPFRDLESGFRVSEKDGAAYYDFSAAGIAEVLVRFLNPRLAELLKNAAESH